MENPFQVVHFLSNHLFHQQLKIVNDNIVVDFKKNNIDGDSTYEEYDDDDDDDDEDVDDDDEE